MADETKATAMEWAKFIVATLLFCGMLYIHSFVKELSLILLSAPWALMGIDLGKIIQIGGGKK